MTKRAAVFFSIGFCVLVPILIIAMIIKVVEKFQAPNSQMVEYLQYYFRSYAVGIIYAFSDWLNWYAGQQSIMHYTEQNNTRGLFTFWGVAKYFPTEYQMPTGYYLEYFEVKGVVQTNIYTIFRGLITDFGLFGTLIFLSLTGYVSTAAYQSMANKYFAPLSQTFYIMLVGAIYASSLISLCTWTSPFVAAALLFLIICGTLLRSNIVRTTSIHLTKK